METAGGQRARLRAALAVDELEQGVAQARVAGALFGRPAGADAAVDVAAAELRMGAYLLLDRIGAGAHGVVWCAWHRPTRRQVALKLLGAASEHGDALAEARALARVNHPNVVAVFEAGHVAGRSFIAMEWVTGQNLAQWLEAAPRSRAEIFAIFAQAARGLHAAHLASIVHRDFKPANVLVGDDGRARVGDFGLAVAPGDTDGDRPVHAGTPAYMAPELHRLASCAASDATRTIPADARSDQFGFFVALYEALVGRRPFAGEGYGALRAAILGDRRDGPSGLPQWLDRGLSRGLASDPRHRYADMAEVATWLERAGARRRSVWRWAIAAAVTLGSAAVLAGAEPKLECETAEHAAARVWPATARANVVESIAAAGPSRDDTSTRVVARLDGWVERWTELQFSTCAARAQGPTPAQDAMMCLRAAEREFTALVGVLGGADATVARHALDAAAGLAQPEHCGLEAYGRVEVAEQTATALANVEALRLAGKPALALALAERTLDGVRSTGAEVDVVMSTVALGRAAEDAGEFDLAVATLQDGFLNAYALRADALAATAAIRLLYIEGYMLERFERGQGWHRAAAALQAERGLAGRDAPEVADLLANLGALLEAKGDAVAALGYSLDALAMRERLFASPHPDLARAHSNIGVVLVGLGRYDEAIAAHQRGLAQRRELHGDHHPSVATSLHNLGFVHLRNGEVELALAELTEALEIREAALGPWHPDVASSWANLATARSARGDNAGAHDALQRAVAVGTRAWGPDHERVTALRERLGAAGFGLAAPTASR